MTVKRKFSQKFVSVLLTLALLVTYLPSFALITGAADGSAITRTSDTSTIEQWKSYFPVSGDLTTENAGGVWSDKSVFTAATTIDGQAFAPSGADNFLVALSAIGSNMSVTGQAAAPTDTVLILDMSNSMSGNVGSLATAANTSLKSLFAANKDNRVAIVVYNASSSVFLPLDTYTAGANGDYLVGNSRNNTISTARNMKDANGNTVAVQTVGIAQRTNIQEGVATAIRVLNARTETADRIPAVVLMTDGEPTVGNTDILNVGSGTTMGFDYSDGGILTNAFVTQLTIAYLTQTAVNSGKPLFYTIGVGSGITGTEVQDILNPQSTLGTAQLRTWWNTFNGLAVGESMQISRGSGRNQETFTITKTKELENASYDYVSKITQPNNTKVNGYFEANSSNLAADISAAFESVIAEIVKASVYTPTLLQSAGHNLSGYISYVDKIGNYMKVSDIKGIMSGGKLFTGELLAETFYNTFTNGGGSLGGGLGTGTALGVEFLESIATRLGVDKPTAYAILQNAWQSGNISYEAGVSYSNWFGWVSNASGAYIQPWNEADNGKGTNYHIIPQNAAYVNRSYLFLGADGDTNMMYVTVRIREKVVNGVLTGEQEIDFAIPASLLPTITYDVDLDENGKTTNIGVKADTPIHLVYEVGLDPAINALNVKDKVSSAYLQGNTDANGNVLFYTNAWEATTGYDKVNTYSYFRPSQQNDRYYYQNDSLVYENTSGTAYNSSVKPDQYTGTLYYKYSYYVRSGGAYDTVTVYHAIPKKVLEVAQDNGDGTWTIKKGTIRSDYAGADVPPINKSGNTSGTLAFSHEPFADANTSAWDDTSHSHVVGVTLANNGRLTLTPETGIRLTKAMAANVTLGAGENPDFSFTVSYASQSGDLNAYAYRYDANGSLIGTSEKVTFTNGTANVTLKAGETLYIGGMTSGTVTVTEKDSSKFVVETVTADGSASVGSTATVTLATGEMKDIDFVNTLRGTGTFTVGKEIVHPFGTGYTVPNNTNTTFKVNLTFTFNGAPLSGTYTVKHTNGNESAITLSGTAGETVSVYLQNNDQYTVYGLPEGTVVKAAEELSGAQKFVTSYWENKNEVTVSPTTVAQVLIINTYTPTEISPSLTVSGTKTFTGDPQPATFTFDLQKYNGTGDYTADSSWTTLDTQTVSYTISENGDKPFAFTYDWSTEKYSAVGTYIYRIHEQKPHVEGMLYDTRIHTFQVNVTDVDMDGTFELDVITSRAPQVGVTASGSAWSITAAFANEYTSNHVMTASIDVQKHIDNPSESPLAKDLSNFEFGLYDQNGSLIGTTLRTNSLGAVRFHMDYKVADVGTHIYTVKEIAPATVPTGWTYTDKAVEITVVVTQNPTTGHLELALSTDDTTATIDTANNEVQLSFTNTYRPMPPTGAELIIDFVKKQLVDAGGNPLTLKSTDIFNFAIYEVVGGVRDTTPVATGTNDTTGKVTFTPTLTYQKVGGPYFYDIVEMKGSLGHITYDASVYKMTVTVTDEGGTLVATPVVESVAGNAVVFNNTYIAKEATLTLEGRKTLTGRTLLENDFQFVLTELGTTNVWYATNSSYGTNESAFAFPTLIYTKTGTYTYTVSEYDPHTASTAYADGVSYDKTVYTVVVTVTDDGTGQLTAAYTVNGTPYAGTSLLNFANTYDPTDTSTTIEGTKYLDGRNILPTDNFTFNLYKEDGTPVETNVACARNGTFAFQTLSYTAAGTYRYTVTETNGGDAAIGYDTSVWQVTVQVTDDNNGKLSAVVTYLKNHERKDAMVFTNTYTVADGHLTLDGMKNLIGRAPNAGEFAFDLYQVNDDTFALTSGQLPMDTATNAGSGEFSFTLDYNKNDIGNTYYYVVREVDTGSAGVSYSTEEYHITVTVADAGDGTLDIQKTIVGTSTSRLEFTNTYTVASDSIDLTGQKILNGRAPVAGEFEFALYQVADNTFTVAAGQAAKATAPNAADRSFKFTLDYAASDIGNTYYYVVREVDTGVAGVSYSTEEYHIAVTVTDAGNGTLDIQKTVVNSNATSLDFTNTYTVAGDFIELKGQKILNGRAPAAGEFEFALYQVADNTFTVAAGQAAKATAPNAADRSFKFTLDYAASDIGNTYYYVVREVDTGVADVTYSTEEYHIAVTVADAGNGTLDIQKTVVNSNATSLDFTNTYTPPIIPEVSIDLDGTKILTGSRPLGAKDFTFRLHPSDSSFAYDSTVIQTAENDMYGNFSFRSITFTQAKTYYFIVLESKTDMIEGVTYDDTVYHVSVTVRDNGTGELIADAPVIKKVSADGTKEDVTEITFVNHSEAEAATLTIGGEKNLSGRTLHEGEFTFVMNAANEKFEIVDPSNVLITRNASDSSFTFDALTFQAEGTYYYIISEDTTVPVEGITFDESKHYVTVTVTKDAASGKLTASYTVKTAPDATYEYDRIIFNNVYAPAPKDISVVIDVEKTVVNKGSAKLTPAGFTFILEQNGTNEAFKSKGTDANGQATITLTFTEDDIGNTYTYMLREINDGRSYVTYSTVVYDVTITIAQNASNELIASVTLDGDAVKNAVVEFVNEYDYTPSDDNPPSNPPIEPPVDDDTVAPKTADSNIALWMTLFLVCSSAMVGTAVLGKKRKENE